MVDTLMVNNYRHLIGQGIVRNIRYLRIGAATLSSFVLLRSFFFFFLFPLSQER